MTESKDIISGILDVQDKIISKLRYNDRAMITLSGAVNTALRVNKINNKVILLGPCTNLGLSIEESAITLNWTDPNDVELNETLLSEWEETILVKKEDSYPVNYADGEIVARTSKDLINKNYYRDHSFVDTNIDQNKTYYYMLFSRTSEGAWNNLIANKFTSGTGLNWQQVGEFVEAGRGPELFPVGTTFIVEHPEYNTSTGISGAIAFRVVGHDQVPAADETIHHTMCLDMCEILFNAPYDAPELEYALTEDIKAIVGKTYYTYDGSTYTALVEGTDYQVGDNIPAVTYYEKNLNNRKIGGSNNFETSNLLQWANSDGSANSWFKKQTIFDTCGSVLNGKNGFLKYLDSNFLSIVKEAKLITANLYDEEIKSTTTTNVKFWPLSKTQITGELVNNVSENIKLSYFSNESMAIKTKNGSSHEWWLRSLTIWDPSNNAYVSPTGSMSHRYSSTALGGVSLACIVGKPNRMQYWKEVQEIVRKGRGPQIFPVGTIFVVDHPEYTHQDGRGLIFRVVGHDQVPAVDETLQHTMCLEMVDCLFGAPYDAQEFLYALTEDNITKSEKTYYIYDGSTYVSLTEGTDYQIGDNIPVATYYEKNIDNNFRANFGSNNPKENNLIQWANSEDSSYTWFKPQTIWDKCNNILLQKNGFMKYLDENFKNVIQSANITRNKCIAEGGGTITFPAKFFLLSLTQVFGDSNENVQLTYYLQGNSNIKKIMDSNQNTPWWLGSPNISYSRSNYYIKANGQKEFTTVFDYLYGVSLACIIG